MDEFFFVAAAVSLVFSVILAIFHARIASRVLALRDRVERLRASPAESLSERLSELEETVSLLANRVKMMRVRNAATHTDKTSNGVPDPYTNPDEWRREANKRLSIPLTRGKQ